jgi:deoxycytidine triphosphate deaminase
MILTADEIYQHVASGKIVLKPFVASQLGTISYKFRLGNKISAIRNLLDSKTPTPLNFEVIPHVGYVLEPGILYLVQTYEIMGSYDFAQQIFDL